MTVANAPTASGHVATKAYVDAAGGSTGMYMLDEDLDGYVGYFNPDDSSVKNLFSSHLDRYLDCDDSDSSIGYPTDGTGGCDKDKDGVINFHADTTQ